MVKRCLIECTLHSNPTENLSSYDVKRSKIYNVSILARKDNFHQVANCSNRIMEGHNYWVLASDLHNLINHGEITLQFLRDPVLLDLWCDMISILQGKRRRPDATRARNFRNRSNFYRNERQRTRVS